MKDTLLILHGALGCKDQFTGWSDALNDKFDCHLVEFSGHGTRGAEDLTFSIERFSADLERYIQEKDLVKPHVLGYSMGGYVALYTSLRHTELIGNIMTLATKFEWNPESSQKEAGYLKPELMLQKVPQLAEQLKQRHGAHWEKVVDRTANMMLTLGLRPLITSENVKQLKNKIKFCVGDKDKMVSVAETYSLYKASENASFCVMPSSGHLPETIDIQRIIFEVESFLLTQAPSTASRG